MEHDIRKCCIGDEPGHEMHAYGDPNNLTLCPGGPPPRRVNMQEKEIIPTAANTDTPADRQPLRWPGNYEGLMVAYQNNHITQEEFREMNANWLKDTTDYQEGPDGDDPARLPIALPDGIYLLRNGDLTPAVDHRVDEQEQRTNAVLAARDALVSRHVGGATGPAADDVARLADYIVTGDYAIMGGAQDVDEDVLIAPDKNGYVRIHRTTLAVLIRNSKKKGWYEGYGQRPLYDGQNLGNPRALCPYDDNPDLSTADWSQLEMTRKNNPAAAKSPIWSSVDETISKLQRLNERMDAEEARGDLPRSGSGIVPVDDDE